MIYLFFNATVFSVTSPRQTIQIPSSNLSALRLYLSVHPKLILFSFTFDFVFTQSFTPEWTRRQRTLRYTEWCERLSFDLCWRYNARNDMNDTHLILMRDRMDLTWWILNPCCCCCWRNWTLVQRNLTLKDYKYKSSFEQRQIICH